MINSELREYCEDIISYYANEYPYYFMHTDTTVSGSGYLQQYGATIYLSKEKPIVKSQYSMTSDEWLVITIYSQNVSYNDISPRVIVGNVSGNVSCNDYEYLYSNVESSFCYASVDVHSNNISYQAGDLNVCLSVLNIIILFVCMVALWVRK